MLIGKKVLSGLLNYQLPTVCRALGVPLSRHHNAIADALACGYIFATYLAETKASSFEGFEDKLQISAGVLYPDSYAPFSSHASHTPRTSLFPNENVVITANVQADSSHPFYGKRVAFTGALLFFSRVDAQNIVEKYGGITRPEGLNKKTDFLVVGNQDYERFGEGFVSSKLSKAQKYIAEGASLEIISEDDFIGMVHIDSSSFEVKLSDIEAHSDDFLRRNRWSEFYSKNVFFTDGFSIPRNEAFQLIGNCGGYGHDYDWDEVPNSDYFVLSATAIEKLSQGIKTDSVIRFEQVLNEKRNAGDLKNIKLLSEASFLEYFERIERTKDELFEMN